MKRFLTILGAAFFGATLGYTVRQLLQKKFTPEEAPPQGLTIGAPVTNLAIATLVGLVSNRRAACCSGFAISLALGASVDQKLPGIGGLHERASRLASEAVEHTPPEGDEAPV